MAGRDARGRAHATVWLVARCRRAWLVCVCWVLSDSRSRRRRSRPLPGRPARCGHTGPRGATDARTQCAPPAKPAPPTSGRFDLPRKRERRRRHLGGLTHASALDWLAQRFAEDMRNGATSGIPDRRGTAERDRRRSVGLHALGEVLAWGCGNLSTPAVTMRAWLSSPPHRRVVSRAPTPSSASGGRWRSGTDVRPARVDFGRHPRPASLSEPADEFTAPPPATAPVLRPPLAQQKLRAGRSSVASRETHSRLPLPSKETLRRGRFRAPSLVPRCDTARSKAVGGAGPGRDTSAGWAWAGRPSGPSGWSALAESSSGASTPRFPCRSTCGTSRGRGSNLLVGRSPVRLVGWPLRSSAREERTQARARRPRLAGSIRSDTAAAATASTPRLRHPPSLGPSVCPCPHLGTRAPGG